MRVVTRLFGDVQADSKRAPRLSVKRYDGALYWSTTCIVLAKIGLWLSISMTRTDWLRSRAAYSLGVYIYIYICIYRRHRVTYIRGQGDSPNPTWKVLLFYDNVLHARLCQGKMETEKRL